jgi:hypothetical protein
MLRRSFSIDVLAIDWRCASNVESDKYGRIQMELANKAVARMTVRAAAA